MATDHSIFAIRRPNGSAIFYHRGIAAACQHTPCLLNIKNECTARGNITPNMASCPKLILARGKPNAQARI